MKRAWPIGVKLVYKKKINVDGEEEQYKAQLVVNRYKQKKGIDYGEVFAHMVRMETIQLVVILLSSPSQIDNTIDGCEVRISK